MPDERVPPAIAEQNYGVGRPVLGAVVHLQLQGVPNGLWPGVHVADVSIGEDARPNLQPVPMVGSV